MRHFSFCTTYRNQMKVKWVKIELTAVCVNVRRGAMQYQTWPICYMWEQNSFLYIPLNSSAVLYKQRFVLIQLDNLLNVTIFSCELSVNIIYKVYSDYKGKVTVHIHYYLDLVPDHTETCCYRSLQKHLEKVCFVQDCTWNQVACATIICV